MAAYAVVNVRVTDPDRYAEYRDKAPDTIARYEGKYLARGGKVGAEVSAEEGYQSARLVALAHLASLKRALGDLDRITAWLRVFAMVNVAPEFNQTPLVTNGYSDLILELYGPEVGAHARSSIGMMIPLNAPVNCEAEVEINS